MTKKYRVMRDGKLWGDYFSEKMAFDALASAKDHSPGQRVTLERFYQPPQPEGHWITEIVTGSNGEMIHDTYLTGLE